MRTLLAIATLLGLLAFGPGTGSASAAPVTAPAITHAAPQQSLVEEVRHRRAFCHVHKRCGWERRCWWRNGHRHCGWKWTCHRRCHWHHRSRIVIELF